MPKPKCGECKKGGKLFQDPADGRSYCHDCWVQFYGTAPGAGAPPKSANFGAFLNSGGNTGAASGTGTGSAGGGGMFTFADVRKGLVDSQLAQQQQQNAMEKEQTAAMAGKYSVASSKKGGIPVSIEKRAKGKKVRVFAVL